MTGKEKHFLQGLLNWRLFFGLVNVSSKHPWINPFQSAVSDKAESFVSIKIRQKKRRPGAVAHFANAAFSTKYNELCTYTIIWHFLPRKMEQYGDTDWLPHSSGAINDFQSEGVHLCPAFPYSVPPTLTSPLRLWSLRGLNGTELLQELGKMGHSLPLKLCRRREGSTFPTRYSRCLTQGEDWRRWLFSAPLWFDPAV